MMNFSTLLIVAPVVVGGLFVSLKAANVVFHKYPNVAFAAITYAFFDIYIDVALRVAKHFDL